MPFPPKEISICRKNHTYKGQWSDMYLSWMGLQIYSSIVYILCCIRLDELHLKALERNKVSVHGLKHYFYSSEFKRHLSMPWPKYRPCVWQWPKITEKIWRAGILMLCSNSTSLVSDSFTTSNNTECSGNDTCVGHWEPQAWILNNILQNKECRKHRGRNVFESLTAVWLSHLYISNDRKRNLFLTKRKNIMQEKINNDQN